MTKVNFWLRPQQQRTAQTRAFQDIDEETGEDKDEPFSLTFWRPSEPEVTQALELRDALVERYVGYPEDDKPPLMAFPPVGGKAVEVTALMCLNAAYMQWMQPPFVKEDRYSAEDFIAMRATLSQKTRDEIDTFMKEVKRKKKKAQDDQAGEKPTSDSGNTIDS